jgi:type IV fimbrial biogenesis protein FimT
VVEVMVVLAIAAILIAVAMPSLQTLFAANQVTSAADTFVTALNEARSEAAKLGVPVALTTSGGVNWGTGWTMFVDTNGNGAQDSTNAALNPPETTLRTAKALPTAYTLNSSAPFSGLISFDSTGRLFSGGGAAAQFVLCQNNNLTAGAGARLITVTPSGRVRIVLPNSSGNLIDDGGNTVASCSP